MFSFTPPKAVIGVIGAALCLSACGHPTNYAPLLPRPTELSEDGGPAASHTAAKPPAPLSAAAQQALTAALDNAQRGDDAFRSLLEAQNKYFRAAENAAPMSEAWVAAQQALSALEAARAPCVQAQADLDKLYVDARSAGTLTDSIDTARAKVEPLVAKQNELLAQLSAKLSRIKTPAR